ncbi:MAG: ribonuclease P protein component [Bacteroidetes bacterium]|nr:ribonuclease P protein component [Bacteroidota bacterium]
MKASYKFRKSERLCSRKEIQRLFEEGYSFYLYPFRVQWAFSEPPETIPAKIVVSVPKRQFKKAVTRNLIRRRIKEAYRLNKEGFLYTLKESEKEVAFVVVYTGKDIPSYTLINQKIIQLFQRFLKEIVKINEVSQNHSQISQ